MLASSLSLMSVASTSPRLPEKPSHAKSPVIDRAIIIGGGLGGLSAAHQLRKAGIDAQVYEKNPSISGGEGTLISLFPNGCSALNNANPELVKKMRSVGLTNIGSIIITPDGTKIGQWKLSSDMEDRYGQPLIAILWKDALAVLSESLPDDCKHTGYECVDVTEEEDCAVAHFRKDDKEVSVKAPLIIGADGIRSTVRRTLFGNIPPRDNGRTMWRAVIERDHFANQDLEPGTYASMVDGRTVFVVNGVRNKLYWAFSVQDEFCEGSTKIRSKTQEEAKERLLEYYKGFSFATKIIEATDPELILERRVLDLPTLTTWYKGRAVLLGDAVHAVTPALGQGANLAFEDGMHLANCLISCQDLRSALERYEEIRSPRAKHISKMSVLDSEPRGQEFYDWLYTLELPSYA